MILLIIFHKTIFSFLKFLKLPICQFLWLSHFGVPSQCGGFFCIPHMVHFMEVLSPWAKGGRRLKNYTYWPLEQNWYIHSKLTKQPSFNYCHVLVPAIIWSGRLSKFCLLGLLIWPRICLVYSLATCSGFIHRII